MTRAQTIQRAAQVLLRAADSLSAAEVDRRIWEQVGAAGRARRAAWIDEAAGAEVQRARARALHRACVIRGIV